ncbi:inactive protein RESTRICTED TEV MOVEMENT 1-like [Chenopodium quinoa]|uniref:inactive protein RESTRICTED TEV MOVEMENT 1-like n=1 Tax=Chenopodium quinoa TaxID=63459 RepID=UPI000B78822A|nr:inactive protein RESTRICTED TEV MOVEMENT 1-like [Chenopodium quinoa]XP_021730496.1 inactive protein RESTRICTED TEV MOVEMENT 1-like [Chenopodium quinoa]
MTMEATHQKEENATTVMLKVGPFPSPNSQYYPRSSDDGKTIVVDWDEKGRTKIAQMFISYDNNYKISLSFQYIEDGQLILSPIFGSQYLDGHNFDTVTFMEGGDSEYITRVSGHHGRRDQRGRGLMSLTIETNKAAYGPFGSDSKHVDKFSFSLGRGDQFGGFHGSSSSDIVTSIGVYLKPIQNTVTLVKRTHLPIESVWVQFSPNWA